MSSINEFLNHFFEVWEKGIFGVNASEIIIGLDHFPYFLMF